MQTHWFYSALAADAVAFLSPLAMATDPMAFWSLLGIHGIASVVLSLSLFPILPATYRRQKAGALLLLFALAFMAPVVGPVAAAVMLRLNSQRRAKERSRPRLLSLPEFDVRTADPVRASRGAIRSRLNKLAPESLRLQSLLALQQVPDPISNPILEELLSDEADDVRLVAFGMLDTKEKKLFAMVQQERDRLDAAASEQQRYIGLRNLAELHWELIYAGLAQGDLRRYLLDTAWEYVQKALQCQEAGEDAALALLAGRILFAMGRPAAAEEAFVRSLRLGQPPASVLPYLAELAYLRRDYAEVRRLMGELRHAQLAPRLRALVDFWTGHPSLHTIHDLRLLPHL